MTDPNPLTEAGRMLQSHRPRQPFTCSSCGAEYTAVVRRDQPNLYCSPRCRFAVRRARLKAEKAEQTS